MFNKNKIYFLVYYTYNMYLYMYIYIKHYTIIVGIGFIVIVASELISGYRTK